MTGPGGTVLTLELLVQMGGMVGVGLGLWWRIEHRINKAEAAATLRADAAFGAASMAASNLAEYKTHVAETYVSKEGLAEVRDQIMAGVSEIKGSVSTIHSRIDQLIVGDNTPALRKPRGPSR